MPARYFLLLASLVLAPFTVFAQLSIQGQIMDNANAPIAYANVLLLQAVDSSFVSGQLTEEDGRFQLDNVPSGRYLVTASLIGYETVESAVFELTSESYDLPALVLSSSGLDLNTVEVNATKPLVVRRLDRTIVNLENRSSTAGRSVLDLMEQLPGIIVSRANSSISMMGKDGVNLLINGRQQYLTGEALFSFLAGINTDNVKSIELITTPPAEFDAQGNAGFIDLILKSSPGDGFQGSYSLNAGYGNGEVGGANVNFNYRRNRLNLFGSYAFNHDGQGQLFTFFSRTSSGDEVQSIDNSGDREPNINNHNARLGLDYELGDKTTAAVLVSGYNNNWNMEALSTISLQPASGIDTLVSNPVSEENNWRNWQANLNLTHILSEGSQIEFNYDYLWFRNNNPISYRYNYSNSAGDPFFDFTLASNKITPFTIQVARVDYESQFNSKWIFQTGLKAAFSSFENAVNVERDEVTQSEFSSLANLEENVYAAYSQLEFDASEKIQFKAGLRYEYATSDLRTVTEGQVVDRKRGRLFPSIFAQIDQLNLTYNRRVNRPSFTDMAPFLIFSDPSTNFGGNPALRPGISDNFQAAYQLGVINLSAQYSRQNDAILRFQNRYDPETRRQIIQPDNVDSERNYVFSVAFPLKITEWWQSRWSGFAVIQQVETNDDAGIRTLDNESFRFNGGFTFSFPKEWNLELSGFYRTRTLNGNVLIRGTGMLNFGLQKRMSNGATISFNVGDIFNSFEINGVTELPNLGLYTERIFDFSNRTFRVSYSASFGNSEVRKNRNRQGPEEAGRVN